MKLIKENWLLSLILLLGLMIGIVWAADTKVTGLTEDTAPASDDLAYSINDPGGTPASKKATWANVITKAHGMTSARAVEINSSGILEASAVTETELNYLDGVTSAIQTQIDNKDYGPVTVRDGDATPEVANGGFYSFTNAGALTITDFVDSDGDHSEFSEGNRFLAVVADGDITIDFSANANIEGNGSVDFTGSPTQVPYLEFVFHDSRWNCQNLWGMRDPTTLAISTIQAAMNIIADADGITLVANQMNSIIVMTGAGDVDIPANMCDSATGQWLTVKSTAAHLNSITSDDGSDQFVLSDGTVLTAANELDLAGAAGNQCTVVCGAVNKWYITGEIGTCVDGGAAD